jgi:cytochrome P450
VTLEAERPHGVAPSVDVTAAELERDPYPFLARLRAEAPVVFVPALGVWLLTRFEDVKRAHADAERFYAYGPPGLSECLGEHHILNVDGEQHARYRRGLHASLSPRSVSERFASVIEEVVERQLRTIASAGGGDLVQSYFEPISVLALGEVLGIPELGADELRRWFHALIAGSSNIAGDRAVAEYANGVSREIDARLAPVFERRWTDPNGSLVSHLLAHAAGGTLAERVADITPTVKIVVSGGLEEPGHGAATVTAALLSDDALRERFAAAPLELVGPATEEAIRWVAPIQQNTRRVRVPLELHGVTIPAGADVGLSVASANRDERVFGADAGRFDLDRGRQPHIGFGFGDHFCPGNYFGRQVVRRAVARLFEHLPDVRLVSPVQFRGYIFRALVALECRWTPRRV